MVLVVYRVLGLLFLMTRCNHYFTKRMIAFSPRCFMCMTSLSHRSSINDYIFPLLIELMTIGSYLFTLLSTTMSNKFIEHRHNQHHL